MGEIMELIVTRHGQTQYNIDDRVCGITDIELTEKGKNQAREVAKKLRNQKIDMILVSPLIRAQETAAIINQVTNCPVKIEQRLREINFGKYEGVKRKHRAFQKTKKNHGYHYPHGESYFQVVQRVYNLLDELPHVYPHQTILLVCHGGIVRTINSYFEEMSNKEIYYYSPDNCCLNYYHIDENGRAHF